MTLLQIAESIKLYRLSPQELRDLMDKIFSYGKQLYDEGYKKGIKSANCVKLFSNLPPDELD